MHSSSVFLGKNNFIFLVIFWCLNIFYIVTHFTKPNYFIGLQDSDEDVFLIFEHQLPYLQFLEITLMKLLSSVVKTRINSLQTKLLSAGAIKQASRSFGSG